MSWSDTVPWLLTVLGMFAQSKAADQSISITLVPRNYIPLRQMEGFVCGFDTATDSFLGEQNGPFIFEYLDNTKSQPKGYKSEVFDVLLLTKDGQPKIMMNDLPCTIDMEAPGLYSLFLAPNNVQCNLGTFSDIEEAKDGYYPVFIGVSRNFTKEIRKFLSDVDTFKQIYKGRHPKLCATRLPVNNETAVSKARLLNGMFNILYNGDERKFDPSEDKVCRSEEETIDAMKKTELIDTSSQMWFEENNGTVSESDGFSKLTIKRDSATKKIVGFVKTVFPTSGGQINTADENDIVSYEGPIMFERNQQSTNLFITVKQDEDDSEEDEAVLIQFDQALSRRKRQVKKKKNAKQQKALPKSNLTQNQQTPTSRFDKFMLIIKSAISICPRRGFKSDDTISKTASCFCENDADCEQFQRCLKKDEDPDSGKVCSLVNRCTENVDCSMQIHKNVDSEKDCLDLCLKFPPCSKRATEDNADFFKDNVCTLYSNNPSITRCDKKEKKCVSCQHNDGCEHLAFAGTPACHGGECKQCNSPGQAQCPNGLFCNNKVDQKCYSCTQQDKVGECENGFFCGPGHICAECFADNHCKAVKPHCKKSKGDTEKNMCVQCKKHEHCQAFGLGAECNNNECGMCSKNENCIRPEKPFCDTGTRTCEANCDQLFGVDVCQTRFPEKPHCNIGIGKCVECMLDGQPADCPTVDGQQYDVCEDFKCGYSVICAGFFFNNENNRPLPVKKGPEVELRIKEKTSHHHTSYPSSLQVPPYAGFYLSTSSLPWLGIGHPGNDPHRPPVIEPFRDLYDQCRREAENAGFIWEYVNGDTWFFSSPGHVNHNVQFNYFGKLDGKAMKYL